MDGFRSGNQDIVGRPVAGPGENRWSECVQPAPRPVAPDGVADPAARRDSDTDCIVFPWRCLDDDSRSDRLQSRCRHAKIVASPSEAHDIDRHEVRLTGACGLSHAGARVRRVRQRTSCVHEIHGVVSGQCGWAGMCVSPSGLQASAAHRRGCERRCCIGEGSLEVNDDISSHLSCR